MGEEEPRLQEDRDEPESEEEQRSSVLFTQEQLEVLLKMGRPDFGELVAALKTGAAKGERFQPAKPGNFDGARDRKVVDAWLAKMDDYIHAAKVGRNSAVELAHSHQTCIYQLYCSSLNEGLLHFTQVIRSFENKNFILQYNFDLLSFRLSNSFKLKTKQLT